MNPPPYRPDRRRLIACAAAAGMTASVSRAPFAQAYPGRPGFMTGSWQGLLAPAGTPEPVVSRLNAEFARALTAPEVVERLTAQGAEPRPGSSAAFGEFMRTETQKWAKLVRDAGIRIE